MLQPIEHVLSRQRVVLASGSPRRKQILENVVCAIKFYVEWHEDRTTGVACPGNRCVRPTSVVRARLVDPCPNNTCCLGMHLGACPTNKSHVPNNRGWWCRSASRPWGCHYSSPGALVYRFKLCPLNMKPPSARRFVFANNVRNFLMSQIWAHKSENGRWSCKVETESLWDHLWKAPFWRMLSWKVTPIFIHLSWIGLATQKIIGISFLRIFNRCSWRFPLIGLYFLHITLKGLCSWRFTLIGLYFFFITLEGTCSWRFTLIGLYFLYITLEGLCFWKFTLIGL